MNHRLMHENQFRFVWQMHEINMRCTICTKLDLIFFVYLDVDPYYFDDHDLFFSLLLPFMYHIQIIIITTNLNTKNT